MWDHDLQGELLRPGSMQTRCHVLAAETSSKDRAQNTELVCEVERWAHLYTQLGLLNAAGLFHTMELLR